VEVTGFNREWKKWKDYERRMLKKKDYVENVLKKKFLFIQDFLSDKDRKFVNENTKFGK